MSMARIDGEDIEWLVALAMREGLVELEVTEGESSVLVRCVGPQPPAVPTVPPAVAPEPEPVDATDLVPVTAPMSGVFYQSPAPDSPAFADVGDDVQEGETVALIEAMKLYNDIPAPCSGRIERILVSEGDHVEADQELMYIRRVSD